MKVLIDGLSYFLHKGEQGENSRDIINSLAKLPNINLSLTKDKFIPSKSTNIDQLDISIDRFSEIYKFNTKKNFDIFHCFNNGFYINNTIKAKKVFSVSTLLPLLDENICSKHYIERFNKRFEEAISLSNAIIVTSSYQKKILEKYFKYAKNKTHIIYPSIPSTYNTENIKASKIYLKSKFSLNSKYIFFSGDLHRKKNIEDILFFFKILYDKGISDYKLVIAITFIHNNSYEVSYLNELKDLAQMLNIYHLISFIEDPSEIDKVHLFKIADKYIDFSITDDFNLSIIKAFICDLDIICTKTELHLELLGEYPNYYEFEEDTIIPLFKKSKSEKEKEQFDYLRDNYRGYYAYKEITNIYSTLLKSK